MSLIESGKIEPTDDEWIDLVNVLDRTKAFLRSSISDWSLTDKEIGEGRALLYKKLEDALGIIEDRDVSEETYLACQQIIQNPVILDTIRLVLSGVYEDFLWELRETLETYKDTEVVPFQPYSITVTKDMFRYVEGKESQDLNYKITKGLTWDDYRINHYYMTEFMEQLYDAIESLPEKYRDGTID